MKIKPFATCNNKCKLFHVCFYFRPSIQKQNFTPRTRVSVQTGYIGKKCLDLVNVLLSVLLLTPIRCVLPLKVYHVNFADKLYVMFVGFIFLLPGFQIYAWKYKYKKYFVNMWDIILVWNTVSSNKLFFLWFCLC